MVEINNLTKFQIDQIFVKKIVRIVLKAEKKIKYNVFSIAFVGTEEIQKLNRKYRNKNCPTDILSFSEISNNTRAMPFITPAIIAPTKGLKRTKNLNLGEIVICPQEVKKNSKKYNFNFKKELARVLIHGALHLLGYEHEKSENKAKKMKEKEDRYLLLAKCQNFSL